MPPSSEFPVSVPSYVSLRLGSKTCSYFIYLVVKYSPPSSSPSPRAAASRCRAKKKVWVDCLEKKAKEIETMNQQFQQEVLMLRSEVQQLKSILIAHKDCPLIVHHTVQTGKTGEGWG